MAKIVCPSSSWHFVQRYLISDPTLSLGEVIWIIQYDFLLLDHRAEVILLLTESFW
jgi:hypothetical protein